MGGGPGWAAPPRRPRTNRCPQLGRLPQPPAASQQVMASLRWTAGQLRHREGEQPISCPPPPPLLTSSQVLSPGPPARDHAAGGRGDAQGTIPSQLRPPGLRRTQPSCISTRALRHLQDRPSAPPRYGNVTAEPAPPWV